MRRRQRKFVGTIVTLVFVVVWALAAMMLSMVGFAQGAPHLLQWIYYAVAGMGWVLPIMPLIRWMQAPDPGMEPEPWIDEA